MKINFLCFSVVLVFIIFYGCSSRPTQLTRPSQLPQQTFSCVGHHIGDQYFSKDGWEKFSAEEKKIFSCEFDIYVDGILSAKSTLPRRQEKKLLLERLKKEQLERKKLQAEQETIRAKKEKQRKTKELKRHKIIAEAASNAKVICELASECKKMFSLTQIFISENATMKIQLATDTIIETYNVAKDSGIAMKAIKMPGKGTIEEISLVISCSFVGTDSCYRFKKLLYESFPIYIKKRMN